MKSNVESQNEPATIPAFSFSPLSPAVFFLLLGALFCAGCLRASNPNLARNFPQTNQLRSKNKNPVIVIPGVLGSQLVNRRTGEKVWPSLVNSDDDTLALPIASANLAENTDDLVATEILETVKFGTLIPEISVYDGLLEALQRYGGYRRGNFDAPASDGDRDTFYVFAYDWRRDNVEAAQKLSQKIEALKQKLGRPDLRFDILAHSMGGLVARYYAMYGDCDALNSSSPQPDWKGARHLNRLVMLGTPNAGSMDALRTLALGYSITTTNRPRISLLNLLNRDSIFSSSSAYQLLPRNAEARFLDEKLDALKLDLFKAETWKRYKWSAAYNVTLNKKERKALLKERGEGAVTEKLERITAERERFLQIALQRAVAFHRALDADSALPDSLKLYLFGGDCELTLDAVVIAPDKKTRQPLTFFTASRSLGNGDLRRRADKLMFVPGDGRVTRRSLFGLKIEPEVNGEAPRAMKQQPFQAVFDCEVHGDLPLNTRVLNNLLTMLSGNSF